MARPTMATLNTAINNVFAAVDADQLSINARKAACNLEELASFLLDQYTPDVDFVVTDAQDATLAAFFASTAGELYVALGRDPQVGDVFQVGGTGDTTDNALAGAKGGAVADGDIFEVTNISTEAVVYLGAAGDLDFTAEEVADFVW